MYYQEAENSNKDMTDNKNHNPKPTSPDEMENHPVTDQDLHERSSPTSSSGSSSKKYSRTFKQLVSDVRVKMKLRGLEEINDDHHLHSLASAIKKGFQSTRKNPQLDTDEVRSIPLKVTSTFCGSGSMTVI